MSRANTIANGIGDIGRGMAERKERKRQFSRMVKVAENLFTDEEQDQMLGGQAFDDFSSGELQGLLDSFAMQRARELEDEKRKTMQLQQQQLAEALAEQRRYNQSPDTFDLGNGLLRTKTGHGQFVVSRMGGEAQQPGMMPLQLPGGETIYLPNDAANDKMKWAMDGNSHRLYGDEEKPDPRQGFMSEINQPKIQKLQGELATHQQEMASGDNRYGFLNMRNRADATRDIIGQLAALGVNVPQGAPAAQPPPAQQPPQQPPQQPSGIRPGQIIQQGAARYRFKGGDPKDPSNYEQL